MGDNLTSAYFGYLLNTLDNKGRLLMHTVKVPSPVKDGATNTNEKMHERIQRFKFPDGRTGADWITDRLQALRVGGEYWKPLCRDYQLAKVIILLKDLRKKELPAWHTNRFVLTLFDSEKDLHRSRAPIPPCLVLITFYPERGKLSIVGTFRAQYVDAKAYGNMLSLTSMLLAVCEMTGYEPKHVYNVAQRATLKYSPKVANEFLDFIRVS